MITTVGARLSQSQEPGTLCGPLMLEAVGLSIWTGYISKMLTWKWGSQGALCLILGTGIEKKLNPCATVPALMNPTPEDRPLRTPPPSRAPTPNTTNRWSWGLSFQHTVFKRDIETKMCTCVLFHSPKSFDSTDEMCAGLPHKKTTEFTPLDSKMCTLKKLYALFTCKILHYLCPEEKTQEIVLSWCT